MPGVDDFLENEAGQDLPSLQGDDQQNNDGNNAANTDNDNVNSNADDNAGDNQQQQQQDNTEGQSSAEAQGENNDAGKSKSTPDIAKHLEDISGGRVKSADDLTSILEKAGRADDLQKKLDDWNAKYGENPYADSFEETRNQLKKQGATENQLKELEELTKLGELSDLSPLDIKVKAMVLRDGIRAEVAERIIKDEFKITDFLNDDDKEVAETRLALSSKEDLKYLQEYKDKLKPVDNSTVQIQREAMITQAKEALKPVSAEFKTLFSEVKDFNITGATKPEDIINFTFKTPEEFNNAIPELVERYIIETGKTIDDKSIADAKGYIENLLWATQGKEFVKAAVQHALAVQKEQLVKKYENHENLNDDHQSQVLAGGDDDAFFKEVAR